MSDVKPLDIDAYLGKVKNRIALVGVELEGGWVELPPGVAALERDSSVFKGRVPAGVKHIGELPVGPAMPAGIGRLVRDNFPQKVNATCGMHVHMSFELLRYFQLLMVPEYQETILHYLTLWAKDNGFKDTHCIWERLAGKSEYCQKKFWPDIQAGTKRKGYDHHEHGHRYTVIHYCGRFRTVECRVLPMINSKEKSISAIRRVLDITNACLYVLSKQKEERKKLSASASIPDNLVYEETIIETLRGDD